MCRKKSQKLIWKKVMLFWTFNKSHLWSNSFPVSRSTPIDTKFAQHIEATHTRGNVQQYSGNIVTEPSNPISKLTNLVLSQNYTQIHNCQEYISNAHSDGARHTELNCKSKSHMTYFESRDKDRNRANLTVIEQCCWYCFSFYFQYNCCSENIAIDELTPLLEARRF